MTYRCGFGVEPTLRSVLPQVDRILLVDNDSGEETLRALRTLGLEHPAQVELITLDRNEGIARALNVGIGRAMECGFRWALTMDHDSVADPRMVERLRDGWSRCPDRDRVVLCAPVFVNRATSSPGVLARYDGWKRVTLDPSAEHELLEPTVVITSGNLVRLDLHARVGGFDERLFIDYVDHDFCLRARRMGMKIIVPTDARLYHSVGNPVSRRLFGRIRTGSNHSPARRFTIGRNRAEMIRRYRSDFPGYALWTGVEFLKDALAIIVCESGRAEKLGAMWRGLRDSRRYFSGNEGRRPAVRETDGKETRP